MEETCLIRLFHGNAKSLNLVGKKMKYVPIQLSQLNSLLSLELNNNNLTSLHDCLCALDKLEILNIGNNHFTILPQVIEHMISLVKLHAYKNLIATINGSIFSNLKSLRTLNLNNNQLTELPPEINSLVSLQVLSLDGNKLEELPTELCFLPDLRELRVCNNKLQCLPLEIGLLHHVNKMYLSQNKVKELPEYKSFIKSRAVLQLCNEKSDKPGLTVSIASEKNCVAEILVKQRNGFGNLKRLTVLDVAGNELRIFPTETHNMPLRELYCEANPLLEEVPVHSVQEEEILSLKELSARLVMKEVKDKSSLVRKMIIYFPGVREMLSQASRCAVCSEAFLNTWLECVKFVKADKELKIRKCPIPLIPIRALLCSYKCFNSEGHGFYGVAFP